MLQSTDRDSLFPGDLGVWNADAWLSLYLDDGITRSLVGVLVDEAKLHALIFARICAVERIPETFINSFKNVGVHNSDWS